MVLVLFSFALNVSHLSFYVYNCIMLLYMVLPKLIVHILLLIVVCLVGVNKIYTVSFKHYILKLNNQFFDQVGSLFRSP